MCLEPYLGIYWARAGVSTGLCTLHPSPCRVPPLPDNAAETMPHAGSRHTHLQFLFLITVTYFAFIYTFILWWRLNKDFQQFLSLQYEYFIPLFMIFRACLDNCIETILCLPGAWPSLLLVPVFPCLISDHWYWAVVWTIQSLIAAKHHAEGCNNQP